MVSLFIVGYSKIINRRLIVYVGNGLFLILNKVFERVFSVYNCAQLWFIKIIRCDNSLLSFYAFTLRQIGIRVR